MTLNSGMSLSKVAKVQEIFAKFCGFNSPDFVIAAVSKASNAGSWWKWRAAKAQNIKVKSWHGAISAIPSTPCPKSPIFFTTTWAKLFNMLRSLNAITASAQTVSAKCYGSKSSHRSREAWQMPCSNGAFTCIVLAQHQAMVARSWGEKAGSNFITAALKAFQNGCCHKDSLARAWATHSWDNTQYGGILYRLRVYSCVWYMCRSFGIDE